MGGHRFGISLPTSRGKKRPPLLNARTDTLRRGSFKAMLANCRCVIPAEGFYEWRGTGAKAAIFFCA
jgi:putative SOS response-associated peptidase YedK